MRASIAAMLVLLGAAVGFQIGAQLRLNGEGKCVTVYYAPFSAAVCAWVTR